MSNSFFHRTYLAQSDEPDTNASITAYVGGSEGSYLSARITLIDGEDTIYLGFSAFNEEELDAALRRAETLKMVISDFVDAANKKAKDVRKSMKEEEKKG